jgi:DNA-binding response OmpR family regulator
MPIKARAKNSRKLLIVDDNDDLRENLADIARLYDFEVLTSADAESAISVSKTYQPDVVLLDVRLPGMNGFIACQLIKQTTPAARIVMMSAYTEVEDMQQALSACAVAVFKKPLDLNQFLTFIGNVR